MMTAHRWDVPPTQERVAAWKEWAAEATMEAGWRIDVAEAAAARLAGAVARRTEAVAEAAAALAMARWGAAELAQAAGAVAGDGAAGPPGVPCEPACTCTLSCDGQGVLRCQREHRPRVGPTGERECSCEAGGECRWGGECPGCPTCAGTEED